MGRKYLVKSESNKKKIKERYNEYIDDIAQGIERDRELLTLHCDTYGSIKSWTPEDKVVAQRLICNCYKMGLDKKGAIRICGIHPDTYNEWMKKDLKFRADVFFAKEFAIFSLLQVVKSEASTAWKLLKSLSRGRYKETQDGDGLQGVQIIFNAPRPDHQLNVIEVPQKQIKGKKEDPDEA